MGIFKGGITEKVPLPPWILDCVLQSVINNFALGEINVQLVNVIFLFIVLCVFVC
jgi:hypothetical protein